MIYTSGSTGRPKGTMNTHRGIVNRLLWMQETYRLTAADRVLQKTPVQLRRLGLGVLLAAADRRAAGDGPARAAIRTPPIWSRTIVEERITHAPLRPLDAPGVPGSAGGWRAAARLRGWCAAARRCRSELERRFFARLPAVALHNLYGPTEAAVDVTWWACERRGGPGAVPIGRPVANTQIHLLDRGRQPVPVGVAGRAVHRRRAGGRAAISAGRS